MKKWGHMVMKKRHEEVGTHGDEEETLNGHDTIRHPKEAHFGNPCCSRLVLMYLLRMMSLYEPAVRGPHLMVSQ